jgi:hypothetical protein
VSFDSTLIVFTTSVVGAFGLGLWLQDHSVIVSFVGEKLTLVQEVGITMWKNLKVLSRSPMAHKKKS